jgi:hypothetical protein
LSVKILDKVEPWGHKVNFVDENEVYLGYDTDDDCCAWGGWFISEDPEFWPPGESGSDWPKEPLGAVDLPGWAFDTGYSKSRALPQEGAAVQFRITDGKAFKYITLYNCHNGYYGKGFDFVVPKDPTKSQLDQSI